MRKEEKLDPAPRASTIARLATVSLDEIEMDSAQVIVKRQQSEKRDATFILDDIIHRMSKEFHDNNHIVDLLKNLDVTSNSILAITKIFECISEHESKLKQKVCKSLMKDMKLYAAVFNFAGAALFAYAAFIGSESQQVPIGIVGTVLFLISSILSAYSEYVPWHKKIITAHKFAKELKSVEKIAAQEIESMLRISKASSINTSTEIDLQPPND